MEILNYLTVISKKVAPSIDSSNYKSSFASCSSLKSTGNWRSGIYTLKSLNENNPKVVYCNMNTAAESLIGYINVMPNSKQIMFSAYSDSGTIEEGNFIHFDHSLINNGDHFSLSRGEFVAPVDGMYEFSFSAHSESKKYADIEVTKNGEKVFRWYTKNEDNRSILSPTFMIKLNAGDKIRLKVADDSVYTDDTLYRTFSGKLLALY